VEKWREKQTCPDTCLLKNSGKIKLRWTRICRKLREKSNIHMIRICGKVAEKANMRWTHVCEKRRESQTSAQHVFGKKGGNVKYLQDLFVENGGKR
jgi:hypothetical protein